MKKPHFAPIGASENRRKQQDANNGDAIGHDECLKPRVIIAAAPIHRALTRPGSPKIVVKFSLTTKLA